MQKEIESLAPIAERLAKFIRLLSSDKDGEVVAAARALIRVLKTEGADIHVLAEAISSAGFTKYKEPTWYDIARECEQSKYDWRPHEKSFINDMVARMVGGGVPSEKQANWLKVLYGRAKNAGRKDGTSNPFENMSNPKDPNAWRNPDATPF